MTRTIISLEPEEKLWLEQRARAQGVSMARLVREAIRRLRQQEDISLEEVLKQTSGLWRKGDGLTYQRRLRKEWR